MLKRSRRISKLIGRIFTLLTRPVNYTRIVNSERGFSLLELLVVMTIMAILGTIVATSVMGRVSKARQIAAKTQIDGFRVALSIYRLDNGQFPATEQGLTALREKPSTAPVPENWSGPYLEKDIPLDPWGRTYVYRSPGEYDRSGYDIYSLGRDGVEGGEGEDADIVSWKELQVK